jgi:hypothetical protein
VPNPPTQISAAEIAEELIVLDNKMKQLKFEYEQYFMGGRPREPALLRAEVQKVISRYSNTGIPNSQLRFKFNNLCARYFAFRRHWDDVLRKIEAGTYAPHAFKAKLHERDRGIREPGTEEPAAAPRAGETTDGGTDLFEAYVQARQSCGEDVKNLTRERLAELVAQQRTAILERTGCEQVRFRVVIEAGRTKLKATPVKALRRS